MKKLKIGDPAPLFSGIDEKGQQKNLDDYKGKKLLLYFYPKDHTPGCTAEACDLRDNYNTFLERGFEILGVSPDSPKSHQSFIEKFKLPFSLIADQDKNIAMQYGVWGEKKMYGKTYMGIFRTSFIINEQGIIENIIEKVDTKKHSNQIL
jgi:thioredoxin-dependent peroxiredoxin